MEPTSSNGGGASFPVTRWGATRKEWAVFALKFGLLPDLLPVVSNPNAIISKRSAIKDKGKVPSRYNSNGMLVGFPKWTEYKATKADLQVWVNAEDYGICVQTRSVRAIDIDLPDPEKVAGILDIIEQHVGKGPVRRRANAARCLVIIKVEGDLGKRQLGKVEEDNLIEFLAGGQQFIAAGTHPSGERYDWGDTLELSIPTISESQFEALWSAISIKHLGTVPLPAAKLKKIELNNDLTSMGEFPPASAHQIAEHCAQIRIFRDTGSPHEPHWFLCQGLVKNTIEGEALVHEWSAKDSRYDREQTQSKIDRWSNKPTFCATFGNYGDHCSKCKHLGKISTPMQLGYKLQQGEVTIDGEEENVYEQDGETEVVISPLTTKKISLPQPFCQQGDRLCYQRVQDGVVVPIPICDVFFYPEERVRSVEGPVVLDIRSRTRHNGDRWLWNNFELPTATIAAGGSDLHRVLGSYEIVPLPGGKEYLEMYLRASMDELRRTREEVNSYRTFGWQDNGAFVFGNEIYQRGVDPRPVRVGGNLAPGYSLAFRNNKKEKAAALKWAKLMGQAYGGAGHEQYQLVLAGGFGAALMQMFNINTGGPINLYGEKGKGKTTCCRMALTIWGDYRQMEATAKMGTTPNAFFGRLSAYHSLPWLLDEITPLNPEECSDLFYHLNNGTPKDAMTRDRKRAEPYPSWSNIGFTTSNDSQQDKVSTYSVNAGAQITRFIEIEWRGDVKTITKTQMDLISEEAVTLAGAPGREFIKFVVENYAEVKALLFKQRDLLDQAMGLGKEERFWSVQAACLYVGGAIANKLGLFPFDVKALRSTIIKSIASNKVGMNERVLTPTDAFHAMLTSFSQQTITTQNEGDNRSNEMKIEVRISGSPVARVINSTGTIYISIQAVREWCSKNRIGYSSMKRDVENSGFMIDPNVKYVLGRGTTCSTGQVGCWMLDLLKIHGLNSNKVAHLKLVDAVAGVK